MVYFIVIPIADYKRFGDQVPIPYVLDAIRVYDPIQLDYKVYVTFMDLETKTISLWKKISPVSVVPVFDGINQVFLSDGGNEIKAFEQVGNAKEFEEFEQGLRLLDKRTENLIKCVGKMLEIETPHELLDSDANRGMVNV